MRFSNIQIARAVAANLVLLSHLHTVEQKYGHGVSILPDWSEWGACGVDLFFVVSGFIMVTIAAREGWRDFIVSRLTRIYPPYWFYALIVLGISFVAPTMVNSSFTHAPSLWRSFLLFPDTALPLLAVGWTLIHELYFYAVFAILLATTGPRLFALLAWGIIIVIVRMMLPEAPAQEISPVWYVVLHPLTIEFITGACIGFAVQAKLPRSLAVTAFFVGLVSLAVSFTANPGEIFGDANWQRIVTLGAPMALITYGLAAGWKAPTNFLGRFLVRVGDASYSIYLSHVILLSALGHFFVILPRHNGLIELGFVVVSTGLANLYGLVSFHWIERPSLLYLRFLVSNNHARINSETH